MSILRTLAGVFVPVREARETSATLAAANAELVLDVSGDESVLVSMVPSAFVGTISFFGVGETGATNYMTIPAYPFAVGSVGGTIPVAGQPMMSDAVVAANTLRQWCIPCGQLKKVRILVSAYTSGSAVFTMRSDPQASVNTAILARPSTLLVTATGAASAAVTATLPLVTGLRHILDFISIIRSATVALTAAAAPVVPTTTNIPGALAFTFGSDVAGVGIDKEVRTDFGSSGLACTAMSTATTVVCPVYTGVIWRITVGYRLGL